MQKCAHLEVSLQQSCAGVEVHSRFGNENSLPGCNWLNPTFLSASGKRRKESGDCEHRRLHPTEWYHFEREMTPNGKSRKSLYIMKKMDFSCSCTKGLEIVYKGTESHFTLYAHTFWFLTPRFLHEGGVCWSCEPIKLTSNMRRQGSWYIDFCEKSAKYFVLKHLQKLEWSSQLSKQRGRRGYFDLV